MGGGPHAERTPGTHLRVLVEENFVPGHGHEELVLEAPQLQEAALIRGLRGIGGVWGHGGPLRSFPLALLRHLLQGLHPLVAVGCGVGAQRGQGWGWGGSSEGPGGCQEEGSSPKMGSGLAHSPSLSARKTKLRLVVTTSNFWSPTLATREMEETGMKRLE